MRRTRLLAVAAVIVAVIGVWAWRHRSPATAPPPAGASGSSGAFAPTVGNATSSAISDPPPGMVWIPGGEVSMGAADPPGMDNVGMSATTDSQPIHRVYVDGFWMDITEVTNAAFDEFVRATKYVTVAERKPRAEDFPGAPPENLVPGGVVFSPPNHPVPLNNHFQWWSYSKGASWRHPD